MEMWKPINIPYKELPGFSKKLLADHFKLYMGYLERLNAIEKKLEDLPKKIDRFEYQRLMSEEGFLRNAVYLHELYFEQLTKGGAGNPGTLFEKNTDDLLDHMSVLALGSTGWVVLALDLWRGNEFLFTMKEHGQGYVAGAWPLLVLDCYEHAYMREYGLNKSDYIGAFFGNVNWNVIGQRVNEATQMTEITPAPGEVPAK